MNQIEKVFEGKELTLIDDDGEIRFLLKDVCEILEIGNHRHVKTRLEEDVVSNYPLKTAGGTQQATFVNEDGLYDVILDSRKPEAKKFRKWITSEVIPSIRKTGSYSSEPKSPAEMLLMTAQQLVDHEQRMEHLEKRMDNTAEIVSLSVIDWRKKVNTILARIAEERGGNVNHQKVRKESYELLERRAKCNLSIRLENKRKKMALEGVSRSKISKANHMDVIAEDARLTEVYLAVVKDLAIRNNVDVSDLPDKQTEALNQ